MPDNNFEQMIGSINKLFEGMKSRKKRGIISPETSGLLGMGLNILSTPPREVPYSNLEVLGRGGSAGLSAMQTAEEREWNRDSAEQSSILKLYPELMKMVETANYHKGMLNRPLHSPAGLWQPPGEGGSTGKIIPGTAPPVKPQTGADKRAEEAFSLLGQKHTMAGILAGIDPDNPLRDMYEKQYLNFGGTPADIAALRPGGKAVKGYDTMEEAVKKAQDVLKMTPEDAGLVATAELSTGNKWVPKLAPNITVRIPPNMPIQAVPGLTYNRRTNKFSWGEVPEGGASTSISDKAAAQRAKNQLSNDYARTGQVIKESQMDAKTLLDASMAFSRSNYPAPNKLITLTGEQLGSQQTQKEIGQLKIALLAFSRKYMRIVTGAARSVAELSIGAQDTAETVLSKFDSWSTLKAKIQQAQQEINNTDKSYKDQFRELDSILAGKSKIGETESGTIPATGTWEELKKARGW